MKVNAAVHEAAEQLGRNPIAREEVARLGRLAIAAAKDETEAPALRAAASAAVTGEFGAQITLLIHQEKLDAPCGGAHSTTNGKLVCDVWATLADVARQLMIVWGECWSLVSVADASTLNPSHVFEKPRSVPRWQ